VGVGVVARACARVLPGHVHNCSKLLRAGYYPNTTIVCAFTILCTYRDSMRGKESKQRSASMECMSVSHSTARSVFGVGVFLCSPARGD
jgi:hypothetical protein